ncbi:MAG: putative N-acetylmannosamine-6-phosphate 2-epimerase [Bacteroidetes bacterium]|nr:putative N-acetylmannosamine-6-phosphate 2-epimerase [Bacteroidota bacterium]
MTTSNTITTRFYHGLIVSCHIDMEQHASMRDMLAYYVDIADRGGAAGLRIEGVEHVRRMRARTQLPIIGFTMGNYEDGSPLITPGLADVQALFDAGADVVAIDGTKRKRPDGTDGFQFFEQIRRRVSKTLWVDVATFREGICAAESGADLIATTLAGYTPGTAVDDYRRPEFKLIHELADALTIPVIAEGRIWTPESAAKAIELGAHAVVVGSAITRPLVITEMFVNALSRD